MYEMSETSSSMDDGSPVSFPFLSTPSGNLKVDPQQVVYESNQLSIVAADPRRTKVNIKAESSSPQDMSGFDKKVFSADPNCAVHKGKHNMEDIREESSSNLVRRQMEMLVKMPPTSMRMFRHNNLQADGDSEEADLFIDQKQLGNQPKQQLQQELNLAKMGFNQDTSIDWSRIELPPKTDLHKLLHYRIANYIKPDILVKIGNHEYRCHLLVLQCYSGFFAEKAVSRIEIDENEVTKGAFASIYDWMLHLGGNSYTLLRRDNILEIFMAVQYLQVKELEEQCWAFIDNEELFSEDRAFMLYSDARSLGNTAVMELMVPRIQRFFLTLVSSKDYLDLSVEEVVVFLTSNYICIHCEMEVFMAAVRWLMCDWEKRQKYLGQVMSCVRFALISPWQLVDIRRNPENQEFLLITRNPKVSAMIEDGLAYAIIKYCYGNKDNQDYGHCIEVLGLVEPNPRNWAQNGESEDGKKYSSYQLFLKDLARYRLAHIERNHKKHGHGDKSSKNSIEEGDYPADMIY